MQAIVMYIFGKPGFSKISHMRWLHLTDNMIEASYNLFNTLFV